MSIIHIDKKEKQNNFILRSNQSVIYEPQLALLLLVFYVAFFIENGKKYYNSPYMATLNIINP